MKQDERDDLLTRLDERTRNIWRTIESVEGHVKETNGHVRDNSSRSRANRLIINITLPSAIAVIITHLCGIW